MLKENFELLAPAGSFEILKAVIAAGADAVYVGGSKYGARAYANNFNEEELLEAIDYVHLRGKKLFLTVNTLFKNDELKDGLYEYLLPYYRRGLDAVIVQDMGVIAYIREYFPDLPVHTSTQMTVTGPDGAKLLKDLGAERVVLARELSLSEMKAIYQETGIELETFVHGALCYSYSGQCLFSSMLGGRSGNRGRCAQPCRLPYAVCDANKKEYCGSSYVLSLKDLCGIEYLHQLRDAGVYSLKIEGRMKQASYAAGVVSFYRKYIDLEQQVSKDDMQHLYELGNRLGFTQEYFTKHNDKSMITFEKPSYEKSNEALHKSIEETYVGMKSQLPIRGILTLHCGQPMTLYVETADSVTASYSIMVEGPEVSAALNKPLEQADVDSRMRKTGESAFYFTDLNIEMDEGIFAPNGVLNQLRRDALEQLEEQMLQKFFRETDIKAEKEFLNTPKQQNYEHLTYIVSCETMEQLDACIGHPMISAIYIDHQMFHLKSYVEELSACVKRIHDAKKEAILRLPAIFRKSTADFFYDIVEELRQICLDGIVVRNYEELYFVHTMLPELLMIGDYSLYTYNDLAKESFEDLGVAYTTIPLELNQKEIRNRENVHSEMIIYGHYPLMTTAGCVQKNTKGCTGVSSVLYLKDRYQVYFPVKNFCNSCYNVIYNSVPTCLFSELDQLRKMNIHRMRIEFTVETGDGIYDVLKLLDGGNAELEHTKGHYKRGVE